jgi:hypothetical protein
MALQTNLQAARPSQHSWFESITEISILGVSLIEGLGAYGIAAHGMCPRVLEETTPLQPEGKAGAEDALTQ